MSEKFETETENRQFTVKMPISVTGVTKRGKKDYLNLNLFRNAQHYVNNNIKKAYKKAASEVLPNGIYYEKYELSYILYLPSKARRDISNVLSIVDKFFCDALVELGVVPEDNYHHLQRVEFIYGGYDEDKEGFVEITVKEVLENKEV